MITWGVRATLRRERPGKDVPGRGQSKGDERPGGGDRRDRHAGVARLSRIKVRRGRRGMRRGPNQNKSRTCRRVSVHASARVCKPLGRVSRHIITWGLRKMVCRRVCDDARACSTYIRDRIGERAEVSEVWVREKDEVDIRCDAVGRNIGVVGCMAKGFGSGECCVCER